MISGLILRYSNDGSHSTIGEHREIMRGSSGHTWWGWWRKDGQEPYSTEILEWIGQRLVPPKELRIGLVDRKLDEYAIATCTGAQFTPDASRVLSPEPHLTPAYYRDTPHPGWFKFVRIETVDFPTFARQFHDTPVGNPTMYVVDVDDEGRRALRPSPNWDFSRVETKGSTILHLSDLHFGESHGYPVGYPGAGMGVPGRTLADQLTRAIDKRGRDIAIVAVTGDLVSKGKDIAASLDHFSTLADKLRDRFGIQRSQIVLIPGNHDFETVTNYIAAKSTYAHETDFRNYLQLFYGTAPNPEIERPFRFKLSNGVEVAGIALNSARLRDEKTRDFGYVSKHKYDRLLQDLVTTVSPTGTAPETPTLISALLHHHLIPINDLELAPSRSHHPRVDTPQVSVTVDAGQIRSEFLRRGVQLALHGHQHVPFVGTVSGYSPVSGGEHERGEADLPELLIVACGSSGVAKAHLPDSFPFNSIGFYEVDAEAARLQIEFWQYLPGRDPVKELSISRSIYRPNASLKTATKTQ